MKERCMGILGKKIGMMGLYNTDRQFLGVTVVETGPCLVLGKRTPEKEGYPALVLGFDPKPARKVNRPEAGQLQAVGGVESSRRFVWELRVSPATLAKFELGQSVRLSDVGFKEGDRVDVTGRSKGKGFQGVMRRHNFAGFRRSHGTHEYFRHGGSIGCRKWPGRVFKNRKMPGHMGDEQVTTQNVQIAQVRDADNVLLLRGSVPGATNGYLVVRPAIKHNPIP